MNIKNISTILFFVVIIISCEHDVILEFDNEPKLCLNCVLNPDSVITASLTLSHALNNSGTFEFVNNAVITLYENDIAVGVLKLISDGKYTLNQKPLIGKTYRILVETKGYQSLTAHTTVPKKPIIEYSKDTTSILDELNVPIFDLNIQLFDHTGKDNYWTYTTAYSTQRRYGGGNNQMSSPYIDPFNRYLDSDSKFGFRYFMQIRISDEGVDGQILKFTIYDYFVHSYSLYQNFSNADEHYDKYIKTVLRKQLNESDNWPFYEPVQIYSNIENGYGIFGSCAITTIKL